jgi:DNA polymerase III delta prime subunit
MAISDKTRKILWGKSNNQCAISKTALIKVAAGSDPESVVGEECHIVSRKPTGPRYDPTFSPKDLDSYSNLILLCADCHKMVDNQVNEYTAAKLREIKQKHEGWVETLAEQYLGFVIRLTSQWTLPWSEVVLELDHIFISEIIEEHIIKSFLSLDQARSTQTPVYTDDVLLDHVLNGHFDMDGRISHILILGEPGFGKTTLMLRWANLLASRRCKLGNGPFPIWLPFKDWAPIDGSEPGPLNEVAANLAASDSRTERAKYLATVLRNGQAVVFLDGFDELFQKQRGMIKTLFKNCQPAFPSARFVVTSRKASYTVPPLGFKVFEILAFSDSQIQELVRKYFTGAPDRANGLLDILGSNQRFGELARTPLFLTIMCMLFQRQGHLPEIETDLYALCLRQLIQDIPAYKGIVGLDRGEIALPPAECPSADEILAVLQALACDSFVKEKDPLPNEEAVKATKQALEAIHSHKDPEKVLEFVEVNTELIRRTRYTAFGQSGR